MTTRCAVLGRPIAHSLSPALHREAYAELGLDWSYDAVEVTEEGLPGFLDGLDATWRGLSLTMPLKRAVIGALDTASDLVDVSGIANTVVIEDGRRHGENTDVPGAIAALRERTDQVPTTAVVLGGGATAASLLLALADLGCEQATLLVRDPARAAETLAVVGRRERAPEIRVARLGEPIPAADLVASTIPAAGQTPTLLATLDAPVVFDVVYDPWPTPLVLAARQAGRIVVGGLDLLVHQAVLQVELMTGRRPTPARMRAAGEAVLRQRP